MANGISPSFTEGVRGATFFATTCWSVVLRAGHGDSPETEAALEKLCRTYWYPVYAWVRGQGHGPDDATDLTQEFFATLLRRGAFGTVDRERGLFRTFLIRSLQHFLVDQHRAQTALKRGGHQAVLSFDAFDPEEMYAMEPATHDTPAAAFDRRWGRTMVIAAMERLAVEQNAIGRATAFAALAGFVGHEPERGEYDAAASRLGAPVNSVAVMVRRLRLRCRELIMEEIMQTVSTRAQAEDELRALFGP